VALLEGVDVVFDAGGEDEEVAGAEVVGLAVGGDLEVAVEDVDGDDALGAVGGEAGEAFEDEERDGDRAALVEGFLASTALAGAGFLLEAGDDGVEVERMLGRVEASGGVLSKAVGGMGFFHGAGLLGLDVGH
jgi:hypothetical protein